MKKEGSSSKNNNEGMILIIIGVIILGFIFGMKPIYNTVQKLQNGTLFKSNHQNKEVKEPEEEVYTILVPVAASKLVCKNVLSSEGGDKTIKVTLYYTNSKLKSIKEDISYSSITSEYSNYILSEQSKYKQRRNSNLNNKGYSIDINLVSTTTLDVSSVYFLEKTDIDDIILTSDDIPTVFGSFDKDIYEAANEYMKNSYTCEW